LSLRNFTKIFPWRRRWREGSASTITNKR